ncbi:MAG: hypothetical protein M3Z46_09895, partial [Actinomycetota bacterium]|nr:hypothetical protein [Actinomycetota bacterium]
MTSSQQGRRTAARSGTLLVVMAMLLLVGCDWSQYGYDASHSNDNPDQSAPTPSSVVRLSESWA